MTRRVVVIFGPPGAGKTTHAHTLGLQVYDKDDPPWSGDEAAFRRDIARLAHDRHAQAAVIRSGATRSARAKAMDAVAATDHVLLTVDLPTCIERIRARKRSIPPIRWQIAAATTWWEKYEPPEQLDLGRPSRDW